MTEKGQATYKEETLVLSVKNVKFRTNGVGRMFPLIQFNQTKELKKRGVDAIIFDNIGTVFANKIGKGAKLQVEFDGNNIPSIKAKLKDWEKPVELPTKCHACGRPYVDIDGTTTERIFEHAEKKCEYKYCSATKRGFMYKMFSIAVPTTKPELVEQFLNKFPVGDTTGSLDSIAEFKYIWDTIKSRGTQKRNQQWNEHHPELGDQFYNLELKIDEFLNQKEIKTSWFWHICNFPMIEENVFFELSTLNPRQLMDGELKKEYLALSKKARDYIETNFDFVDWLTRFFESYGDKTWTK